MPDTPPSEVQASGHANRPNNIARCDQWQQQKQKQKRQRGGAHHIVRASREGRPFARRAHNEERINYQLIAIVWSGARVRQKQLIAI